MLWSNQMLDVTAAVSTRLSFWGFGFLTWIPSTWHSPWSMVNTTGWLNQSTLGGSCFKAQLELGLNWWWWEQSRSGSMWPHSSVLLFFNSSFRALYTRLNFHNTENLGFFFFLCQLPLKPELPERTAEQFIRLLWLRRSCDCTPNEISNDTQAPVRM